jgi:hypothetical protein
MVFECPKMLREGRREETRIYIIEAEPPIPTS